MLEKNSLAVLIVAVTSSCVLVWILTDFFIYKRKRAIIRENKSHTFYRPQKGPRIEAPIIKSEVHSPLHILPSNEPVIGMKQQDKSRFLGIISFFKGRRFNKQNVPIIIKEGGMEVSVGKNVEHTNENMSDYMGRRSSFLRSQTDPVLSSPVPIINRRKSESDSLASFKAKFSSSNVFKENMIHESDGLGTVPVTARSIGGGKTVLPPLKRRGSMKHPGVMSEEESKDGNYSSDSSKSLTSRSSNGKLLSSSEKIAASTSQLKVENETSAVDSPRLSKSVTDVKQPKPRLTKRPSKNRVKPLNANCRVFSIGDKIQNNELIASKAVVVQKRLKDKSKQSSSSESNTESEYDVPLPRGIPKR